jgi:capsid protein
LAIALLTLKDVDIWEYLSLQNAKAGAGKGGYLVEKADGAFGTPPGAIDPTTGKPEVDEKGYKYMDIEGNTVEKLPRGLEFVGFDPKYPHEQHSPYLRSSGRKIFSGMGSDYAVVTGDREGESYSSFRGGEIKQDASAAYNQMLIIEMIKIPQYEMFIKYALRAGALAPLNMALYEKYLPCFFGAYRKPKADRLKEALADSLEEISGWVSKYTNQQKRSQNPDDILNDKIALLNMEQKKGMKFESTKPGDTTAAETANADNSTQNTNADAGAIPKKNLTAAPQLKEINELLNTMRSMYELLNKGEDNG